MRHPQNVLNSLTKHSKLSSYKYERLYRILFNSEMYYTAYQHIYAKPGNMTSGSDGSTIDQMSLTRIDTLIEKLKNEQYYPQPVRRIYIPKKNGKKRPLGIPTFDDKLLQEVIRMILSAIYENSFETTSHGFRPRHSCHTAVQHIRRTFTGVKWFIEGDIASFFDNINHEKLISILEERISDGRFIRLIRKFLKAGYLEDWIFHKTNSGTPQGGIVSPILANIYLDKLDKYMEEYRQKYDTGRSRKENPDYKHLAYVRAIHIKQLKNEKDVVKRKMLIDRIKIIEKNRVSVPYCNQMDSNYRRIKYVRYADDFLIGVIGSYKECKSIKEDIRHFLDSKLNLALSEDKTLITHSDTPARFLSFDINARRSNRTKRDSAGKLKRTFHGRIVVKIPPDVIKNKLLGYSAMHICGNGGKERWKSKSRPNLLYKDDLELLQQYNAEIRGLYNYYSIALNASTLNSFKFIMEYSMYKTFASKYKTTVHKICRRYRKNKVFTVSYTNKKGEEKNSTFYNSGFKRQMSSRIFRLDSLPDVAYTYGRTSLIDRLKAEKCELCDSKDALEMHHIRKMSDLSNGKQPWQIKMIERRRKTMAVCTSCHRKIHTGK